MIAGAARAETSVYYIPAEFPEVCAELLSTPGAHDCPGDVTHQAPAFCDAGLRGLTLALQALGLPACDAGNADLPGFDMVVVVDDRNLSPRMTEIFGVSVADSANRRVVYPVTTRSGERPRALLIGEALYAEAASDAAWTERIRNAAGRAQLSRARGIPHGKGVFVFRATQYIGTPDHVAERAEFAGLSWVAFPASYSAALLQPYVTALRRGSRDVGIFVWQYNTPEGIDGQVQRMVERARAVGADGIILDAEGDFRGHRNNAAQLMATARQRADTANLTVGYTTIGLFANDLPADEFRSADFGMPQIYDRLDNLDAGYPARVLERWNNLFDIVIPVSGAHHLNCAPGTGCAPANRAKTVAEMTQLLSETDIPDGAVGWWSFWFLDRAPEAAANDRWSVIRDTRP
jgi:hypothetical protein